MALPAFRALWAALGTAYYPVGDWALIERGTRVVGTAHTPLVGAYSRFGWDHPGPWLFWVLSVPYRLFGASHGLLAGAALLNAGWLLLTSWCAHRRSGWPLVALTGAAVAVLVHSLGSSFLFDPWNPYVPVLGLLALFFVCWSLGRGEAWAMPVASAWPPSSSSATSASRSLRSRSWRGAPPVVSWCAGIGESPGTPPTLRRGVRVDDARGSSPAWCCSRSGGRRGSSSSVVIPAT